MPPHPSPSTLRSLLLTLFCSLLFSPLSLSNPSSPHPFSLQFSGQKSFSSDQLRSPLLPQIRDIEESGLSSPTADDAAYFLASFYRKNGFSLVVVDYQISPSTLLLKITEGPRTLLHSLTFLDHPSIPTNDLFEYLIGSTPQRLAADPSAFPYTIAEIDAGIDRLRGLYISKGFLDVSVEVASTSLNPTRSQADVTIQIHEGTRYSFGEIHFAGELLFPRPLLLATLAADISGPFSQGQALAMQHQLQSFYKSKGYFQAEVLLHADPSTASNGLVPVTFTIRTGPRFTFIGVTAHNETKVPRLRENFLARRFGQLQGQIYQPQKLDEIYRELLRTGLFENLRVSPSTLNHDQLRWDFTFSEAKSKVLGFTLGYGSYDGALAGFRVGDLNFLGNGRPLSLAAQYTQRGISGELLYVDPWLFDSHFILRTRIFSEQRNEMGYDKSSYGWRIDLSRKALPHLELGVFTQGQRTTVTNQSIPIKDLGPTQYSLQTLGLTQSTDYRDDPVSPRRGFIFTSSLDLAAIDRSPAFLRSNARLSYYLPIGKSLLALGARGGYIAPITDNLPIDVLYFNGGANSVRSFAERQLGPRDSHNNPLGGEILSVFNAELDFPISGALRGATFTDAGSLKNSRSTDDPGLRYAIGAGLRYNLPIGPIRIDYGVNPSPKDGENFGAFHFSFGSAF